MKVISAVNHPLLQIGIRNALLNSNLHAENIEEVGSATELLKLSSIELADIVLLDMELPDRNGLDLIHDLKKMYPKLPILTLSAHHEEDFVLRALKARASGYLNTKVEKKELIKAIRTIVRNKKLYINARGAEILARHLNSETEELPHQRLSDREYEVFSLIANGKAVSEIAEMLSLSVQTIHTYRRRIKEKTGMDSNAEFIRYALKNELVA